MYLFKTKSYDNIRKYRSLKTANLYLVYFLTTLLKQGVNIQV
jgi:hypothetical protein